MQRRGTERRRPLSRTITAVGAPVAVVVAMGLVQVPPASAEPKPTRRELTVQQKKLADEAEKLSEQYNGLRVRLEQAQRAAKVADANARRQRQAFETVRSKVARQAAESYKNGNTDPAVTFASAGDPQAILDRSAALNYFANQSSNDVSALLQTTQASERARRSAEERRTGVQRLAEEAERKRSALQTRLKKVERQLGGLSGPAKSGPAPNVDPGGASAKALGAVKAALSQLGTPYSWGGGTASGPSYGTAQGRNIKGFDCSGLTLYAYAQVGISLPHYTGSQFNAGTRVSQSQLKPGDLVFFYSDLHHMGMYIGGGKMVHAPQTGDVIKVSPISGRPFAGGVRMA